MFKNCFKNVIIVSYKHLKFSHKKKTNSVLTGVDQWIECWPANYTGSRV